MMSCLPLKKFGYSFLKNANRIIKIELKIYALELLGIQDRGSDSRLGTNCDHD
jgi:hypothetical protein